MASPSSSKPSSLNSVENNKSKSESTEFPPPPSNLDILFKKKDTRLSLYFSISEVIDRLYGKNSGILTGTYRYTRDRTLAQQNLVEYLVTCTERKEKLDKQTIVNHLEVVESAFDSKSNASYFIASLRLTAQTLLTSKARADRIILLLHSAAESKFYQKGSLKLRILLLEYADFLASYRI